GHRFEDDISIGYGSGCPLGSPTVRAPRSRRREDGERHSLGGRKPCEWIERTLWLRSILLSSHHRILVLLRLDDSLESLRAGENHRTRHYDLLSHELAQYDGPVRLIRRLQEEVLITNRSRVQEERRASNRANELLKRLMQQRHAETAKGGMKHVDAWLSMSPTQRAMARGLPANASEEAVCMARVYQLCEHYLVDFNANHNK
ncbi:hypothetical protein PMAYCL1PPCAC_13294, partial [Pristionchus mayeri]